MPGSLDPALALALAWQPASSRPALEALLLLDRHLARVVGQAREPVLAQIRLAWWREQMAKPAGQRIASEPILLRIGETWAAPDGMVALIDGWEAVLGDDRPAPDALDAFVAGRAAAFAAFAQIVGQEGDAAGAAGRTWALYEAIGRGWAERELPPPVWPLQRSLRGLAVIGGLAHRAIERSEPMMYGRLGALVALRLGMLGK